MHGRGMGPSKWLIGVWRQGFVLVTVIAMVTLLVGGCGDDGDEPVAPAPVRDPAKAKSLAVRYQPSLEIEKDDGFWPMSVLTIDKLKEHGAGPCLSMRRGEKCNPLATVNQLPWDTDPALAYIDYPADNTDVDEQREEVRQELRELLGGQESSVPWGTRAQLYFYVTGRGRDNPISLQYWFYYPFNYLPLRTFGHSIWNTDLHEGDFEGLSILLSAQTHRPVYVWMLRHTEESERFVWNEGALKHPEGHPIGYVAQGSHATYGSCGHKYRSVRREVEGVSLPIPLPYDSISCSAGDRHELASTWPVVNIARTWWACWPGHFGYAPGYGQPRNNLDADGPASPLFQQKFGSSNPRPCADVDPPDPGPGDSEIVGDGEVAKKLGVAGGRLSGLFESCPDWSQRPAGGSYLVACDEATLKAFFESGLEEPGDQDLRVVGDPAPTGPTVPAVFESPDSTGVDRAVIRTHRTAHPEVYVAIRHGEALETADFAPFELSPGQKLRLKRPNDSEWQLVDLADGGSEVASARVRISHAATPPSQPAILSARRLGSDIDLRFSGGTDPATELVATAGYNRRSLDESDWRVGSVRGEPSGEYQLTIADPERHIRLLRIVASRDGSFAVGPPTVVEEP